MASKNNVPARTRRTPVVVVDEAPVMDKTTSAPESTPAPAPVVAPEGTSVDISALPVVTPPASKAAPVLADEKQNGAKLEVPVKKTPAQESAATMLVGMRELFVKHYAARPQGDQAFAEPSKDELKAMRRAYAKDHNLDLTDEDDLVVAALAIKAQVDAARNAHAVAAANQSIVDKEWARAALIAVKDLIGGIETLAGGPVRITKTTSDASTSTGDAPKRGRKSGSTASSEKWATWAPAMHKAAEKLGLTGVYLIDRTAGGYKNQYHALKVRADGSLERAEYDPTHRTFTDTGAIVSTWRWFGKEGVSFEENPNQERFQHDLFNKDEMYGIAMLNAQGGIVDVADLTYDLRDDKGVRKPGSLHIYALFSAFMAYAGVDTKK